MALAVSLVLTACNGDPEAEPTTTVPAPSTLAPPTTTDLQHAYLTDPTSWLLPGDMALPKDKLEPTLAYIRAEQSWLRAGMDPVNPDSPDIAATTGGKVLENVQTLLRDRKAAGRANRPPEKVKLLPKRFLVESDQAVLDLCVTQHVPLYNVNSGNTLEDRTWTADYGAQLKRAGSGWILTALERTSDYRDGDLCGI